MKQIHVSYTCFPVVLSVRDWLQARWFGGKYQVLLHDAFCEFCKKPGNETLQAVGVNMIRFCMGNRSKRVLWMRIEPVVITQAYTKTGTLYHFTPVENVDRILREGLQPKNKYVFLTDDPDQIVKTYLPWKTNQRKQETSYGMLAIQTERLLQNQAVYCTDQPHEFVTGGIAPVYISVVSPR